MRRATQAGLTLLELLLTVVIFSLVVTIFSQAIFQIGVFERASVYSMGGWQREWTKGFALDDYFKSQVLVPEAKLPQASGGPRFFKTWWLERAGEATGRPVQVELALRALEPGKPDTGLFMQTQGAPEVQVAQWERSVSFEFVNGAGDVSDSWPVNSTGPAAVTDEVLPRIVRLLDAKKTLIHQWSFQGLTQPGLTGTGGAVPFLGMTQ